MKTTVPAPRESAPEAQDALNQLRQGLGLTPTDSVPDPAVLAMAYERACEHLARGEMAQAEEQFEALVQSAPLEQRFQFGLGLCLQEAGRIVDALSHYGVAYVLDASDAACAFRMGECLAAAGLVDDAREAFEATVALSKLPTNSLKMGQLAQAALAELSP